MSEGVVDVLSCMVPEAGNVVQQVGQAYQEQEKASSRGEGRN